MITLKRSQTTISIYIEEELWREAHLSIFGNQLDTTLPVEEFKERFFLLERGGAKRYALRLLAKKAYLSFEIITRLTQKLVSERVALSVVEELSPYFEDEETILRYVENQKGRNQSSLAIRQKLIKRGVSESTIDKFIQDDQQQILALLSTKYSKRSLHEFEERQRVIRALCRRGFHLESILACIDSSLIPDLL